MKNRCLLLACLLSTLALTACGTDGGTSDETAVEEAIKTAMLSEDSDKCTKLYTPAFREQLYNETGAAGLKACEEVPDSNDDRAESVEISNVTVDDTAATADVAISGGSFDGQTITIALIEDGEQWKLDALTRFAKLDVDALAKTLEKQVETEGGPSALESCFIEKFKGASQPEIEEMTMSPSRDARVAELAESCARQSGAGAQRVAPRGSRYSYLVPYGFETTAPENKSEADAGFLTAVASGAASHPGAGIAVAEIPALPPVEDAAELRDLVPKIRSEIAALRRPTGADSFEVGVAKLPGFLAHRWNLLGGRFGPFPGTDVESFVIYTATGGGVTIACRWGREAGEREVIQRGCQEILGSLEVD